MLGSKFNGMSSGTLYSFFPRNKRLKISKRDLNFINTKNSLNRNSSNRDYNNLNNDSFNINGLTFISQNKKELDNSMSNNNFEAAKSKWNYNYGSNKQKQKYASLASSAGKTFYRNSGNKLIQSSYGRKYYLSNGYDINKDSKKRNLKMVPKKGIGNEDSYRGLRVSSVEKNSLNNRIIERIINQYETNVKKVLYEIGVVKDIQDSTNRALKSSNWNNGKSANIKETKKGKQGNKNYNNLPVLGNQNQERNKNILKKKKNIGYAMPENSSETNIININNFINFFSDINNVTYNNNNHIYNNSNNNNNNILNFGNNNNNNNLYASATDTTINNNLACNSTNSNIGNNNIIFGNSSNKNSFHQFSFGSKNIQIKSRATNSLNSACVSSSKPKKLDSGNSASNINDIIMEPPKNDNNENTNYIINNNYTGLYPKKVRAASTASRYDKLNSKGDNIILKESSTKIENSNTNLNNIININGNHNINKGNNSNLSSTNYISIISNNTNKNKVDKLAKYEIGHIIGKGAYAIVKIVTNKITKEQFAMKIYEKEKLSDNSKKKCVYREIEILKRVKHPNIAKLIEVINTPKQVLIIQELVEGISLRDYYNREIRNQKGISEHKSMIFKKIFKQIFAAMNYLHKNYMAHRDIKLENILMTKDYIIKIIDFGFGMYNPENKLQSFFCGTPNYMPPEIAFKKPYIGQKADLWSLGVLVYKLFCADFPFKGKNEKDLYKCIKRGKFTMASYTPEYIKKIIVNMIELDPKKRIDCEHVLNSSWLRE